MIFDWYNIFSLDEFLETELTSRELVVLLETIGRTTLLISRGNVVSVTYQEVFLPINFLDVNPYIDSGLAVYIDGENNVWIGFEVAA